MSGKRTLQNGISYSRIWTLEKVGLSRCASHVHATLSFILEAGAKSCLHQRRFDLEATVNKQQEGSRTHLSSAVLFQVGLLMHTMPIMLGAASSCCVADLT